MATETPGFRRRVFVVMPFGNKEVPKKPQIDAPLDPEKPQELLKVDFDAVYQKLFKPALEAAGLQPFRADDETAAGDILKDMFAELVTADFVLADISILNANVFYELGIRHVVGPRGVICLHAGWAERPFDVAPQRTFKYDGKLFQTDRERDGEWEKRVTAEVARLGETLRKAVAADRTTEGSPVYGNLPNLVPPDASRIGTAKFKYYQAQAEDWNQRVIIAGREGRAEDILTLAGDVPSPYYRRKLLRQCGDCAARARPFRAGGADLQGVVRGSRRDRVGGRISRQVPARADRQSSRPRARSGAKAQRPRERSAGRPGSTGPARSRVQRHVAHRVERRAET